VQEPWRSNQTTHAPCFPRAVIGTKVPAASCGLTGTHSRGGSHGQAYPRIVAAYLHRRVRRRRHARRNPTPLARRCPRPVCRRGQLTVSSCSREGACWALGGCRPRKRVSCILASGTSGPAPHARHRRRSRGGSSNMTADELRAISRKLNHYVELHPDDKDARLMAARCGEMAALLETSSAYRRLPARDPGSDGLEDRVLRIASGAPLTRREIRLAGMFALVWFAMDGFWFISTLNHWFGL
jgi:hypothetical protein